MDYIMRIFQKSTLLILIAIFSLTAANSQTIFEQNNDSSYRQLQNFRQLFWDSLPKPNNWTNDYENLFTDTQEQHLNNLIYSFKKKTSIEICIVTIDTIYTSKEKFNDLALRIAKTWGVGEKDKNNGITICISAAYRMIRICNGYGIEKYLTDAATKKIIDNYFIPSFKIGNYYQGTIDGLNAIMQKLKSPNN